MQAISILFLKMVDMSLTAGVVIGVVLIVRWLLRGLPKSFAYMLWVVVAFRLVVPLSADSDISIFNLLERKDISSKVIVDKAIESGVKYATDDSGIVDENFIDDNDGQAEQNVPGRDNVLNVQSALDLKSGTEGNHIDDILFLKSIFDNTGISGGRELYSFILNHGVFAGIMAFVWLAGIMIFVSYTVVAHMRIRGRIRYSIRLYDNVYACDQIRSPFVIGIVHPRIYLPFRLGASEQRCILAHEQYHIVRRDYLIKNFAYVLVVVYWFQPMVWIAYRLMCIDMEMSCDEKIISGFTVDMRKEYSRLLLAFATNKRYLPVSPLAFGEENTMKRIRNILHYRKAEKWKMAAGVAAIMLTAVACATDASTDETIVAAPDRVVSAGNVLTGVSDRSGSDGDTVVTMANGTSVTTHHAERHHVDIHDQIDQHRMLEHHQAQWAENSMCDLELCSLDYADADKIVFHISSGLFRYDLQEQKITHSIDLEALHCQEVQTGGKCRVTVYQDSDGQLRAVITPYPYTDKDSYVYDLERDELFTYDDALLERYTVFEGLVSKYDLPEEDNLTGWEYAEYVLPLGAHSYGVLCWESIELGTMYYEADGQKWELFHEEQATLPRLLRQEDSFYQSIAMHSGKDVQQCLMDYSALYNRHDYAGVCALSTGLKYSDEMQQMFGERSDELLLAEEVNHSEDMKEYLYRFVYAEGGVEKPDVYVTFQYIEGAGWRAEGLPRAE